MTARQRVQEFLRQWTMRRGRGNYSDDIYGVHVDPAANQAELTVQDLQAVLAEPDAEGLATARKVATWELGDPDWANLLIGAYLDPAAALERLRAERENL